MILYFDSPVADGERRRVSPSSDDKRWCLDTRGPFYLIYESAKVLNHGDCAMCSREKGWCWKRTTHETNYRLTDCVPVEFESVFFGSRERRRPRSFIKEDQKVSVHCPGHEDKRKSAVKFLPSGRVWCFACKKMFFFDD